MNDTNINTERNWSLYLDEGICQQEKQSIPLYIAVLSVMELIAFYFMISLCYAVYRLASSSGSPENKSGSYDRYKRTLHILLFGVILSINLRLVMNILQLSIGEILHDRFAAVFLSKAGFATITNLSVYAFLWTRQWILYNQPILREVKTNVFKTVNVLVLVLSVSLVAVGPGERH